LVTCGELLDDVLEYVRSTSEHSTEKVWRCVVEADILPFFGRRRAATLSTEILKEYRRKRLAEGRTESTCNREPLGQRQHFSL
jgi:hypothetical protein